MNSILIFTKARVKLKCLHFNLTTLVNVRNLQSRFLIVAKATKRKVADFWKHKCAICGNNDFLEFHHIIQVAAGGTDDYDNLILLCACCHAKIHNRTFNPEKPNCKTSIDYETAKPMLFLSLYWNVVLNIAYLYVHLFQFLNTCNPTATFFLSIPQNPHRKFSQNIESDFCICYNAGRQGKNCFT